MVRFLDIIKSSQGKDNCEHLMGISVRNQANKEPYNILTVILSIVHFLFVMTVNHLKEKLYFDTGCPKKNFKRLISCTLKMTVLTEAVFIFSKSSYSNLNFGIKQSKIGSKFAEQWLPKVKISEPFDDRRPDFFEKYTNLRQPYCIHKVHWSVKNS